MIRAVPLLLALLACACGGAPTWRAERPTRTLWLAVQGTPAELACVRDAAHAWEIASRGAVALPAVASNAAPSEDTVRITFTGAIAADVDALTAAYVYAPAYRDVVVMRPRVPEGWCECIVKHEIGHVLREHGRHDARGLMAVQPRRTECIVTTGLAAEIVNH